MGDCYRAQIDSDSIYKWNYEKNMSFNLMRCVIISFNKRLKTQVHLGKPKLQFEESVEDLGLTVQNDLS